VPGLAAWLAWGSFYARHVPGVDAIDVRHPQRRELWEPLGEALEGLEEAEEPLGDSRTIGCRGDAARKRLAGARRHVADAASAALTAGLKQRAGGDDSGLTLDAAEWRAYCSLRDLGAVEPAGLAVCRDCSVVFRPRRKAHASKCSICHASPRPAVPSPPRDGTPAAIAAARATGWEPSRGTVARRTFDDEGEPIGWRVITTAWCTVCGQRMEGRADARTCSATCRARRHRTV